MDILPRLSFYPILDTDALKSALPHMDTLKDVLLVKLVAPSSYNTYYLIQYLRLS